MRCLACRVMGGTTVETEAEAREIARIPHVEIAIRTGQREPIKVGDEVSLRPCIGATAEKVTPSGYENPVLDAFERENGRPCPRVELDPDNYEAAQVFGLLVREDKARAFPVWWAENVGRYPEAARTAILDRALGVLGDGRVTEALYPKQQPQKKGRR